MATKILTLDIEKVLDITPLSGTKKYNSENAESRLYGKEYRTFIYDGKAFVVESTASFGTDFDNGDVYQVKLQEEDDQLSFVSHRSMTAQIKAVEIKAKMHRMETDMKAYTVEHVQKVMTLQPEDLLD